MFLASDTTSTLPTRSEFSWDKEKLNKQANNSLQIVDTLNIHLHKNVLYTHVSKYAWLVNIIYTVWTCMYHNMLINPQKTQLSK